MPRHIELGVAHTDVEHGAVRERHMYWADTDVPVLFDQRMYTPKMSQQNGAGAHSPSEVSQLERAKLPAHNPTGKSGLTRPPRGPRYACRCSGGQM
jgi:hypothetical protein